VLYLFLIAIIDKIINKQFSSEVVVALVNLSFKSLISYVLNSTPVNNFLHSATFSLKSGIGSTYIAEDCLDSLI